MIKIIPNPHTLTAEKLASIKKGGFIILDLQSDDMEFSIPSILQVVSIENNSGQAKFLGIREEASYKTFERFNNYKGCIINCDFKAAYDYDEDIF